MFMCAACALLSRCVIIVWLTRVGNESEGIQLAPLAKTGTSFTLK
jgi:hypothetical protein